MDNLNYDLIIVGGGPAGLTAGLYAARARLKTLLLEKTSLGGQAFNTEKIENYPGFPAGISGPDLMKNMEDQAKSYGLDIQIGEVSRIKLENDSKQVSFGDNEATCKTVIIAAGSETNQLGVMGEDKFIGKGVSFCATCDGFFFRDKKVVVVGGGDRAVQEALFLTKFCSKIFLAHRREQLRATKILQDRLLSHPKIKILWNSILQKIEGDQKVERVEVKNLKEKNTFSLEVDGVFIFTGMHPNNQFLKGLLQLDNKGFIQTDANMQTSVPGIFAAGDVRDKLLRQVSTAVGDGATAAFSAERLIEDLL